jgi:uncharacterized protein DUF2252
MLLAALAALLVGGNGPGATAVERQPLAEALRVDPAAGDLAENPEIAQRVAASPHSYFRFINIPFSRAVCAQFADETPRLPTVTLQGDAHIEQYAVTSLGRGLTDFDDSSLGPPVIDLVRFGVSLRLATRLRGWEGSRKGILDAFFRGYREALRDPSYMPPAPRLAEAIRLTFKGDRPACLARGEAMMEPVPTPKEAFEGAAKDYVSGILSVRPDLSRAYFHVKKYGRLRLGIGSALDRKYLLRIEGPTAAPDDDVLIEAKEVRDIAQIDCVVAPPGAERVLSGHARMANQPFAFAGFVRYEGRIFWLHAWPDDYVELSIGDFRSPKDLEEIALDAGAQIGRGQPRQAPAEQRAALRNELLAAFGLEERRMRRVIDTMTDATVAAWEEFRKTVTSAQRKRPQ